LSDQDADSFRCGFAAIVGRPNVGKSTLMNALLGRKLSIVSPKPQTTRHRILGILTETDVQIIFVDTPGLHASERRAMNRHMNRAALTSLVDSDVNLFLIEAMKWTDDDEHVLEELKRAGRPILLLINKVDQVRGRERLLPFIEEITRKADFADVLPMSGLKRDGTDRIAKLVGKYLPASPPHFPEDQYTDRSTEFQIAEIIREKLTLRLRQELPYGLTVQIERMAEEDGRLIIHGIIWVERNGQKAIVIGQGGEQLKEIGRAARLDINRLMNRPVHLELWVKVKENWSDNETALRQLGYEAP
jgi:GTPase